MHSPHLEQDSIDISKCDIGMFKEHHELMFIGSVPTLSKEVGHLRSLTLKEVIVGSVMTA